MDADATYAASFSIWTNADRALFADMSVQVVTQVPSLQRISLVPLCLASNYDTENDWVTGQVRLLGADDRGLLAQSSRAKPSTPTPRGTPASPALTEGDQITRSTRQTGWSFA